MLLWDCLFPEFQCPHIFPELIILPSYLKYYSSKLRLINCRLFIVFMPSPHKYSSPLLVISGHLNIIIFSICCLFSPLTYQIPIQASLLSLSFLIHMIIFSVPYLLHLYSTKNLIEKIFLCNITLRNCILCTFLFVTVDHPSNMVPNSF